MRVELFQPGYLFWFVLYQVGNISVSGNGDGFRRLLLESSVAIRNPAMIATGGK